MEMATATRIGTPIVPRNKADPTQSYRAVNKMYRDIEERYLGIKTALKRLFDERLTGRVREGNTQTSFAVHGGTIYQVNASAYIYDMTAQQLADLLERVQTILDDYLLEGIGQDIWALSYVSDEYQRGTLNAFTNLSVQSQVYAQQTTLSALLSTPAYQNQIAAAFISTYSDWKGVSDAARADLANIISDSIGRGVNPRETAGIISKRLNVSMSSAKRIAQTEQVGALRQAQWAETEWAKERLALNTALLHLSALKATTRTSHAFWHGKTRTVEEVREWYSRDGNRYHCYCSQIPVILDIDGMIVNSGIVERLSKERKEWQQSA
ncbi:phage head morphogenesis protein%2C SPP1 gp7 family [Yersinia enterocolitica]|nr:phage minor head protein [Yersinia enterocolitica]CQD51702.1 phage head morphogenesis protein%2C SPP1 gp7 family [Yersinia enterocolitica]